MINMWLKNNSVISNKLIMNYQRIKKSGDWKPWQIKMHLNDQK